MEQLPIPHGPVSWQLSQTEGGQHSSGIWKPMDAYAGLSVSLCSVTFCQILLKTIWGTYWQCGVGKFLTGVFFFLSLDSLLHTFFQNVTQDSHNILSYCHYFTWWSLSIISERKSSGRSEMAAVSFQNSRQMTSIYLKGQWII